MRWKVSPWFMGVVGICMGVVGICMGVVGICYLFSIRDGKCECYDVIGSIYYLLYFSIKDGNFE